MPPISDKQRKYIIQTITGLTVFVTSVIAMAYLTVNHEDSKFILTLAGPVVAALLITAQIGNRSDKQDQVLDKISHQTNGVLKDKIKSGVYEALQEIHMSLDNIEEPAELDVSKKAKWFHKKPKK